MSAPKLKIEGTQIPTKIPSSLEPVNQRKIDSKKEIAAAAKIDALIIRGLMFMIYYSLTFCLNLG